MQQEEKIKITRKKVFILSGIIIFAILIFFTVKIIYNRINDATIEILVAPESASITIDENKYSNGTHRIPSGKHTITISKEGFKTITEEIDISSTETYYYFNSLIGSDGSMNWYYDHEEDALLLDTIVSEQENQRFQAIVAKYPLIDLLPINVDTFIDNYSNHIKFDISYTLGADDSPIIIVTDYTGNNKENAYAKIKEKGFNPEDYFIRYIDKSEPDGWAKTEDYE